MPQATSVVIYNFANAIDDPKRPMFRQCMPGVKRYVFGKLVLSRSIEVLLRDINSRYLMEWGLFFLPFSHTVFNAQIVRCSGLHQKSHRYVALAERGA